MLLQKWLFGRSGWALVYGSLLWALVCAPAAVASDVRVVASIRPLALMAADLGGDWLQVDTLLAANQEPHHLSLSISQRRLLSRADLVLWVDPGLEAYLVKPLSDRPPQISLAFRGVLAEPPSSPLAPTRGEHDDHSNHRGDDHGEQRSHDHGGDFHYWLDPDLVAEYYQLLAARLIDLAPTREAAIRAQLQQRLAALRDFEADAAARLAPFARRPVLVDHQAYGYFARHFNLNIAGALVDESGVNAGPRTLAGLGQQREVRCVVVELLPPSRRADKMAAQLNVPVVAVNPLGSGLAPEAGFIDLLAAVTDGFVRCLR